MAVTLATVLDKIGDRLLDQVAGIRELDSAGPLPERPDALRHKGISLFSPSTEIVERYGASSLVRVMDTIVVELAYRIRPKGQNTDQQASAALEDLIVQAVTARSWLEDTAEWGAGNSVLINVATISRTLVSNEWLVSSMGFDVHRDQALGG